jgi:hypothetical protein
VEEVPEEASEGRPRRASELVSGYDGRPVVEHLRNGRAVEKRPRRGVRRLIYVTRSKGSSEGAERRSKSGTRGAVKPRSLVLTDGDIYAFAAEEKRLKRLPPGTVKALTSGAFDAVLGELELVGFSRLRGAAGRSDARVGIERAIHFDEGDERVSYVKQAQQASGHDSPRLVFTRCEHVLIGVFLGKRGAE